jgi:hypothetical protein
LYRDRFRVGVGLVLGAVVFMSGGCGDPHVEPGGPEDGWSTLGCGNARVPAHVTVGNHTMPTTPVELATAMERIERAGREDFAESFAGIEVDQERVRAIVYRVPSEPFDDFIRRTAESSCLVVRNARHSAKTLDAWHDRIIAELAFWSHRGLHIVSVGARHDGSGVEIGTDDVDKARQELLGRHGADAPLVFVAEGPVRPLSPGSAPASQPAADQPD